MSAALERELLKTAARLQNMPRECARGGSDLVDWHRDIALDLRRIARRVAGGTAETVFRTGSVSDRRGNQVRVERR